MSSRSSGLNSGATAMSSDLSGGLQSLLMVLALLGVAMAVDPLAAIVVLVSGFVLLQILRPLNLRSRRANRELSKATRAMATQVTEYTRLSRDFRLFGVEAWVMDRLRGVIQVTGRRYRNTQRLGSIAPTLYQSFALGIIIVGIIFLAGAGRAGLEKDGIVLILVLRGVSYGAGIQGAIQGLRFAQGLLEDLMVDLGRFQDARVESGERVPESFGVDFDSVEYSYDGVTLALSRHHHAHTGGQDRRSGRTLGQRQDDHQPDSAGPAQAHERQGHDRRRGRRRDLQE